MGGVYDASGMRVGHVDVAGGIYDASGMRVGRVVEEVGGICEEDGGAALLLLLSS
jgi:hypothetical protein